jgi:acyl-CoA thioesterase FadM
MISDPNHFMMTASMEIKYRKPVPTNTPLTLTGRMVRDRGRIARAAGTLRLPDGSVAVEAELTMADMPEGFEVTDRLLERLGWQIYP